MKYERNYLTAHDWFRLKMRIIHNSTINLLYTNVIVCKYIKKIPYRTVLEPR